MGSRSQAAVTLTPIARQIFKKQSAFARGREHLAPAAAAPRPRGTDDMTEREQDFARADERDQYGAKTNDDPGSSEQAKTREREMEETGEENAA